MAFAMPVGSTSSSTRFQLHSTPVTPNVTKAALCKRLAFQVGKLRCGGVKAASVIGIGAVRQPIKDEPAAANKPRKRLMPPSPCAGPCSMP